MGLQVLWELYPVEDSPVDRCKDLLLSGRLVGDAAYVKGRSHVDTFAVKFLSGIVYTVYLSWSYVVFLFNIYTTGFPRTFSSLSFALWLLLIRNQSHAKIIIKVVLHLWSNPLGLYFAFLKTKSNFQETRVVL